MNRFLSVLSFFMILFSFPHHSPALDYPLDIQRIIDKNEIVVALYERDQLPFFKVDKNGDLQGFDIELAKGIAAELGVNVRFNRKAKTFNETVDLVVRGEADIVISKLSKTLARAKKVFYTKPYIVLRKGLLINRLRMAQAKKGRSSEQFIKNLTGMLGVIAGTSYVGFAKTMFPHVEIIEYPTWEEVVDAVTHGKVIAAFRDELELKKVIKHKPNAIINLQTVIFEDTKDPIAIAVSSDAPHLLFWLNLYLDTKNIDINADKLLDRFQFMFED